MLRLNEVASQSVTFVKPALRKAKTNTVNSIIEMDGPSGHYLVVFSLDMPPLLAVGWRPNKKGREHSDLSTGMGGEKIISKLVNRVRDTVANPGTRGRFVKQAHRFILPR